MMDLHCHTLASDGQYTATEVIAMAQNIGLTALSITDHDTIDALDEGTKAAKLANIQFIPGIEINALGKNVHVLGYNIDYQSSIAREICENNKHMRQKRAELIFAFLQHNGIHLTWENINKYAQHKIYARPHFARAMLEHRYVSSIKEAFDKYLDTPEFRKIKEPRPTVESAVLMIKQMKGIPVLAHPMQQRKNQLELDAFIRPLKDLGLAGIECYHSENTPKDTEISLSLAQEHSLLITGGSDFHGEKVKPAIKLGTGINNNLNFHDDKLLARLCYSHH